MEKDLLKGKKTSIRTITGYVGNEDPKVDKFVARLTCT